MGKLHPSGKTIETTYPKSIYEASKIADISLCSLRNAAEKGNRLIVRRRDKQSFLITWCSSHDACFEFKKEKERLERKQKALEEVEKAKELERLRREEYERDRERQRAKILEELGKTL